MGIASIIIKEEDIQADRGKKENMIPLTINERWFPNHDSDSIVPACPVVPAVEYKLFNKNNTIIDTLITLNPNLSCQLPACPKLTSGDIY